MMSKLDPETAPLHQLMAAHLKDISTARGRKLVEQQKVPGGHKANCWPMVSMTLGVPPSQVPSMIKHLAGKGVKCDFDKSGHAILTSAAHRRRVSQALDRFDNNAGYSDAAPGNKHYDDQRDQEVAERKWWDNATKVDMNNEGDRRAVRHIEKVLYGRRK